MTAGERLFIELQLKAIWRKVAAQRRKNAASGRSNSGRDAVKPLFKEIEALGNQYILDLICSGMGTYILAAEKDRMFDELGHIMNRPETKEKLKAALYQNGDLEEVRRLSLETRKEVARLLEKYKSHVK